MTTYIPSVRTALSPSPRRETPVRRFPARAEAADAGLAQARTESRVESRVESRAAERARAVTERARADLRAAHAEQASDNRAARHPLGLR